MTQQEDSSRELLTSAQVEAEYKISRTRLSRLRSSGGGPPFVRLGTGRNACAYYRRHQLEAWLAAKTENGANG